MKHRSNLRRLGASLALALVLPLAACGEDAPADAPDTLLPNRGEDRLIDGVTPADQVETDRDPTPQSTTGGDVPGYAPVDEGEGTITGDDTPQQPAAPANRVVPGLDNSPAEAPAAAPVQ